MSGTLTTDLPVAQATAILQAVYNSLQIVLTSPARTKPGQLITASLVPASPLLDVSELANGILNLAVTSKDVLYKNANVIPVPAAAAPGDFGGDLLAGTVNAAGGQPFPPPLGALGGSTVATLTNIPGLLGQIFGTLAIPQLKVRIQIKWVVRKNGKILDESTDFLALQGIRSPAVSLTLPPTIHEMRLDTITIPRLDVACLHAEVSLSLGSTSLPTLVVPAAPILLLPLLLPSVVAIFSEPNFGVLKPTMTLVVVPRHSPLSSLKPLLDELNKIQNVISGLSSLAQFAGWLLGLSELTNALTDQPRVRFVSTDKIDSFDDVDIKPGPLFGLLGDDNFDDVAKSILMLGVEGTKAWFYNDDNQTTGGDQGYYALEVQKDKLYVMVRDLAQTDASSAPPDPHPPYPFSASDWHKDSYYYSPTWNGSMSSFQFDPPWLQAMADEADAPVLPPILRCRPIRPIPTGPFPGAGRKVSSAAKAARSTRSGKSSARRTPNRKPKSSRVRPRR